MGDGARYAPAIYVGEGDKIFMFGKCAFRFKAKPAADPAEMRMACLWRFEGDKAVSLVEIFDSAVAMRLAMA